jgi:hypothetical protein
MIRFLLLFSCGLLTACVSPGAGPPPVDMDRLAAVTADLQMAEAMSVEIPVMVRDSIREVYYDRVLADHDYNRASYDSITWILRQEPVWIDSLYEKVAVILIKKGLE